MKAIKQQLYGCATALSTTISKTMNSTFMTTWMSCHSKKLVVYQSVILEGENELWKWMQTVPLKSWASRSDNVIRIMKDIYIYKKYKITAADAETQSSFIQAFLFLVRTWRLHLDRTDLDVLSKHQQVPSLQSNLGAGGVLQTDFFFWPHNNNIPLCLKLYSEASFTNQ